MPARSKSSVSRSRVSTISKIADWHVLRYSPTFASSFTGTISPNLLTALSHNSVKNPNVKPCEDIANFPCLAPPALRFFLWKVRFRRIDHVAGRDFEFDLEPAILNVGHVVLVKALMVLRAEDRGALGKMRPFRQLGDGLQRFDEFGRILFALPAALLHGLLDQIDVLV